MSGVDPSRALAARADSLVAALRSAADAARENPDAMESLRRIGHFAADLARAAHWTEMEAAAVELAAMDTIDQAIVDRLVEHFTAASALREARSVLIVEDDGVSAIVLHTISTKSRSFVRVVQSLEAARREISEEIPDVVLLDLCLPDGDGRSLLTELRSDPVTAGTTIIVVSASDHEYARAECRALGADRFISKPVDPEELTTLLHSVRPRHDTHRASDLVDRGMLVREFSDAAPPTTIAMLRFHPIDAASPAPAEATITGAAETLADRLRSAAVIGPWADDLFCAVFNEPLERTEQMLTLARTALRLDGRFPETMTLAAGLADGSHGGLLRAVTAGSRRLRAGMARGGDRVVSPKDLTNARVLFAEDDRVTAALVVSRLEEQGFEVDHVENGAAAIEHVGKVLPSLILLDVNMPQIDGFSVLQAIRDQHATAEIPVIMLTDADSESSIVKAFELGAHDYIVKPFSPSELTARVERLLR